jgi:hypothetical protein
MTDLAKPDIDQASEGSPGGTMREVLEQWLRNDVDDMVPATVISYDDVKNRAVLKPIVMLGTTEGQKMSRAQVSNIPVFRFGGGGFFIRAPIKPGDMGWLKANDRDLSLIMQGGGKEDWPNTTRLHSFSDAMFFPDTFKSWVIDGANLDAMVIQSIDGSVCMSVHADKVNVKTPLFEVESPLSTFSGDIEVSGTSLLTGQVTGAAGAGFAADVVAATISLMTHQHVGPASAPLGPISPTGTPIP